jgi:hypothetical protein
MLRSEKERLGIDISKKPRKNTFNHDNTLIAYEMWKILRENGGTWTKVVKLTDAKYATTFNAQIGDAQDYLKAYGYNPR